MASLDNIILQAKSQGYFFDERPYKLNLIGVRNPANTSPLKFDDQIAYFYYDDNGNAVVITAEVAIALQVFDSPAELVSAIFDDPGQVLTAVANIGADMSDEEREESEEIIVASVIASQAAINAAGMAAGTATRIPTPSSPAGGPMAGNDKPKSARRRKP